MEITLDNYNNLLSKIQKTIGETQQNITKTVNHEKIIMSWEIGRIIDQHLTKNDRSEPGEKLFEQLETDTLIKQRDLYQMRSFYTSYPTLPAPEKNLSWSHYRILSSIKNEDQRQYFEDLAIEDSLGSAKLQQEITQLKSKKKLSKKTIQRNIKLTFNRGKIFTYKITRLGKQKKTFIDCGFNIFHEEKVTVENNGQTVNSTKTDNGFSFQTSSAEKKQLHTYKAYLDRVVDGDTIRVILDLGFKIQHREILRLSQINAPERGTEEGAKCTQALKNILKNAPFLIIKTNKTDIYGRYIADVFLGEEEEMNEQKVADEGIYLSQKLLDLGIGVQQF